MREVEPTASLSLLITGGNGFIGRRVVFLAQQRGINVLAPRRALLDWTDATAVRDFIATTKPQAIIHLASRGVFAPAPNDPVLIDHETAMMKNLLAAAPSDCRLINGGSMAEYGRSGRLTEELDCSPRNAYARAKFEAGRLLLAAVDAGMIMGCQARIFGAFGLGEAPSRLIPMVIARLAGREPVQLSDGQQLRDFIHVDDVARALLDLASSNVKLDPVINIGTGKAVQLRFAVKRIAGELGAPEELLHFGAVQRSAHDQDMLEADPTRLQAAIGWVPPQHFLGSGPVLPLL